MNEACLIAKNNARKSAEMGKRSYDKKLYGATLQVGDPCASQEQVRAWWNRKVAVLLGGKCSRGCSAEG